MSVETESSRRLKYPWHEMFYYLVRKSFQINEEWRLFYCDSTLFGFWVMQIIHGRYTEQAQESLLNSGATYKAVFILGRKRSSKILLRFLHADEASKTNAGKRIIYWPPFWNKMYILLIYTTLCSCCDITSHQICINQNLE